MTRSVSVQVGVALAVVMSVLAATAPPATAAHTAMQSDQLVVGSQWTDFGTGGEPNPQTLANLTRDGSGDSAVVSLSVGPATVPDEASALYRYDGDLSDASPNNNDATGNGQYSFVDAVFDQGVKPGGDLATDYIESPDMGLNTVNTSTIGGYVIPSSNLDTSSSGRGWYGIHSGNNMWGVGYEGGDIVVQSMASATVQDTLRYAMDVSAGERLHVAARATDSSWTLFVNGAAVKTISTSAGPTDAHSGRLVTATWNSGTFSDTGSAATFDEAFATDTALTESQVADLQGGTSDSATYIGALHGVSDAEQAAINITQAANVSVDAIVRTDAGTVLNQTTLSGTGNHTLALADSSSSQLETVLDVSVTGDNPQFELADESILFTNHAPQADNLSPPNGTQLSQQDVEFSVDVSDPEFPTAQGDSVTAELFVDGASAGTETVTSNQTVSITESLSDGGSHEYYWTLTDEYGATTTTATQTVHVPSTLYIRSETNPTDLVTSAQVNITYYYGDELLRANTSNGKIDLSGLPVDEPIIALAEADGYHTRTAVITNIYDQDSLYLLNESIDSHELIFDITDPTGAFPRSNTILEVQRDIALNGSAEWRTVAGDLFGAQGVVTDLEAGERYRLIIRNLETGERAGLGSFTPTGSQQITLEPESATVDVGLETNVSIGYAASRTAAGDAIVVEYADPDQSTEQLTFMIHERFNESNVLLANQSFSNLGNLSYSEPLSAAEQNQSWVVDFYWTRSGESSHAQVVVGQGPRTGLIPGSLDDVYRASIGVAILLITALLFSQLNVGVGAITTTVVGGLLWYLGFLTTVTTGPAIVLSFALSGLLYYNHGGSAA